MIRLNILYPNTPGCRFDVDYYVGTHMPMSRRLLGAACKNILIERGVAGAEPGSPPAYVMSCHMLFNSIDDFLAVWAEVGEQLGGDIPRFTDVQPLIQFSEVLPLPA